MGVVKRWSKYKCWGGVRYFNLCMEEKLTIATYNKAKKLLQRGQKYLIFTDIGKIG